MIKLPNEGRIKSINEHNCNIINLCDWIEACIGFSEEIMTRTEVIDILLEEEIYNKQDFAGEFVDILWIYLKKREKANKKSLFYEISGNKIQQTYKWEDKIAHSFCLLLSLAPYYDSWKETDYNIQGELFEKLVKESLIALFPELKIFRTGWSPKSSEGSYFKKIVLEMQQRLNLANIYLEKWDEKSKKEYGLDILVYFDFQDNRAGTPFYMMQCASGGNWEQKLHTPDLEIWRDILKTGQHASKGFVIPFCISDEIFYRASKSGGFFLDRCRLLKASEKKENWVSP